MCLVLVNCKAYNITKKYLLLNPSRWIKYLFIRRDESPETKPYSSLWLVNLLLNLRLDSRKFSNQPFNVRSDKYSFNLCYIINSIILSNYRGIKNYHLSFYQEKIIIYPKPSHKLDHQWAKFHQNPFKIYATDRRVSILIHKYDLFLTTMLLFVSEKQIIAIYLIKIKPKRN